MSSTTRSLRSSISPFRSRKSPAPLPPSTAKGSGARQTTPSSTSSKSHLKPTITPSSSGSLSTPVFDRPDSSKGKENVTVTVRFRPLSGREINKGDEVAWFADGDYTVRNEYNPSIAYGFDRVFGPATTTRHVYDVAAQHVVSGAMEGVNGTVFAYGVTSSGKTHTMHGEQKSPGIIPLAVKDVFGIIQESPGREFLLRVSYLEIYNEVINDLLNPTGQNLRIREDSQGTYVEGIKEEVVLSPAHALSLIASGEAHRHVGSNNFNLLSSRSHTIFTLTIESSSRGENNGEEVALSQLHLIDLAGSESSKTETTGLRRKEGSYINKSLLTLGTVISKLTDEKSTHIPYRDSKLTRLLQSSLSGHGRVSLICTVTPASSNTEETHNTLKFAHRSKHVEIKASRNKIMDEKSLIKKYQKEISNLKEELQQLKRGMMGNNPYTVPPNQEDLVNLKLQLEAGQVKLQSRLEEEEQAKAALMGRIQRLTKLILVSTKNTMPPSITEKPGHRRRHSFGEDELAYLPERKRDNNVIDDDIGSVDSDFSADRRSEVTNLDELVKDYRRNKRHGMLGWFKLKKPDQNGDSESSGTNSPASSTKSSQNKITFFDSKDTIRRKSVSRKNDERAADVVDFLPERTQAGDLFSATLGARRLPSSGTTITDQMDLFREQIKMLAGEVALCMSSLKRLSEQSANSPQDSQLKDQMQRMKDEIREKKNQMRILEQRMMGSVDITHPHTSNNFEISQALSKLASQLNEKTFELEIKSADNRILQEQLQMKISENGEMQETILLLRQQLDSLLSERSSTQESAENKVTSVKTPGSEESFKIKNVNEVETFVDENTPTSVMSLNRVFSPENSKECGSSDTYSNSQLLIQAAEIETLKQEKVLITEEKDGLIIQTQKLAEEGSYAKELAAAAAVELRNLAEEVTKLSYQNAKLTNDLKETTNRCYYCKNSAEFSSKNRGFGKTEEFEKEQPNPRFQRQSSLISVLSDKDKIESELRKRLNEAKRHEQDLENELAKVWDLVAKMKKSGNCSEDTLLGKGGCVQNELAKVCVQNVVKTRVRDEFFSANDQLNKVQNVDEMSKFNEFKDRYENERRKCEELQKLVLRLKGDDVTGLDITTLEELQNLHVEAITKICHAKCSNHLL